MLQQRLASGSEASCSYISRPALRSRASTAATAARSKQPKYPRTRSSHVCRVAEVDEAEEMEMEELPDTPYESMVDVNNIYPDYEDPDWVERVTNWEEFWHEDDDALGIDDDDPNSPEVGIEKLQRAYQLCEQLTDLKKRTDVEQMITNSARPKEYYETNFTSEVEYRDEMSMMRPDPNPQMNIIDARALAEKRRTRAIFDTEWEQQTALLARPTSFTLRVMESDDPRFESTDFDWVREEWTHEQIENMIIGGGKYVHPDKIGGIKVLNPFVPVDYAESAIRAIPDTEEFLKDIGHLVTEDEIMHLKTKEVTLEEKDFVDPTLVFEDESGMKYQEAPVNRWAELQRYRDRLDVELFETVVDKMTAKQQQAEARRAAKEAALAGEAGLAVPEGGDTQLDEGEQGEEDEGEGSWLDDVLGQGFTEYMADDDDETVVYDNLEEGDDEAAEQEEEGVYVVP